MEAQDRYILAFYGLTDKVVRADGSATFDFQPLSRDGLGGVLEDGHGPNEAGGMWIMLDVSPN